MKYKPWSKVLLRYLNTRYYLPVNICGAFMHWLSLLTQKDMSGHVMHTYCKVLIMLRYKWPLGNGLPSFVVNLGVPTIGARVGDASSILALWSNSRTYFFWVRYSPCDIWWTSMPREKWRSLMFLRENILCSWWTTLSISLEEFPVMIISSI